MFRKNIQWKQLQTIGFVFGPLYIIGIPLLFGTLLWKYRKRIEEPIILYWLGRPLSRCYKPSLFWFQMIILLRRLLLAIFLSLIPTYSGYQPFGIFGILLSALAIQFYNQPYHSKQENILEEVSLITITLSYGVLRTMNHNSNSGIQLEYIVLIGNIIFVLAFLGILFKAMLKIFSKHD